MAGSLGDFGSQLIMSLGGKPTPSAQKLFGSWQRMEGGMTNNAASWNPLNLTAPGSGLPRINSVGVVAMPSEQAGVKRTAQLLRSGYPALATAFRTGQVDFSNPEIQADLNRWLSGKHTPGMTAYVRKIAAAYGQNLPAAQTGAQRGGGAVVAAPSIPQAPQKPAFDPMKYASNVLGQYASGGRIDFTQLPGAVASSYTTPPPPPAASGGAPLGTQAPDAAPISEVMPSDNIGARAVKMAATQLGKPYVFGSGPSTASFDCSDLVQWTYKQLGVDIPRDTYGQQRVLQPKSWKDLQPGDPIYRRSGGHVVIYAGGGRVIAAPHTGTVVQYQPLSNFSQKEYVPYSIPH